VKIKVGHLHGGRAKIYSKAPVNGTVEPFVAGQHVAVSFFLNGRKLLTRNVAVQRRNENVGSFKASIAVREDGKYAASAKHVATAALGGDSTVRKSWRVSFPALHPGECGRVVKGFKKALAKMGYASGSGRCFNERTGREVLAYRKVNGMSRTERAGKGLVKDVFGGRGGYKVRYPGADNMGWPPVWGGGYHYMQLEGWFLDGGIPTAFFTHTGRLTDGTGEHHHDFPVEIVAHFSSHPGHVQSVEVVMDVSRWYDDPVIDLRDHMAIMDNTAEQDRVQANGANVFRVGAIIGDDDGHDHP